MSVFYGPVLSKRFGFSLGVDIVALKHCTYDCIYCQLGKTTHKTMKRRNYVIEDLKHFPSSLLQKIKESHKIDYITFSGSGEPTLNSKIAAYIKTIKDLTDIPVAVLTGGGLLGFDGVIEDLMDADLIKVSVDAPNEALLQRMNRPAQGISFTKNIKGLKDLLDRFQGKVWTETMLVKGVNDQDESLYAFKNLFDEIGARIEKIHLNSPSRPSQGKYLKGTSRKKLERFREIIGSKAMLVEDVIRNDLDGKLTATRHDVFELLKRRPASVQEISQALDIHTNEAIKYINFLMRDGNIKYLGDNDKRYYYNKKERSL